MLNIISREFPVISLTIPLLCFYLLQYLNCSVNELVLINLACSCICSMRTIAACLSAMSTPWTGCTPTPCTMSGWLQSQNVEKVPPHPPLPPGLNSTVSPLKKMSNSSIEKKLKTVSPTPQVFNKNDKVSCRR